MTAAVEAPVPAQQPVLERPVAHRVAEHPAARLLVPTQREAFDADLGDAIAAGHHGPVPRSIGEFEQRFVAVVESSGPDAARAWDAFYDRTLERVAAGWRDLAGGRASAGAGGGPAGGSGGGRGVRAVGDDGTVATFSRIWAQARALQVGASALDVGACFAFLPLAWAALPGAPRLLAVDLAPASAALAARQARRLGRAVDVVCADGTALPVADRTVDTVLLLHVLEHVDAPTADRLLGEALRVAVRRVVVAVPVEAAPDPVFGHRQVYDPARLHGVARRTGWSARVFSADGAWLVLDRP